MDLEKPLSRAEMARELKIGATQLDRYVQQGCPREANSQFLPSAVKAWLEAKQARKARLDELKERRAKADIRDVQSKITDRKLSMAIKRGELHSIKDCQNSLGELLGSIWAELQGLPHRVQSAFPEVPNLKATTERELNTMAARVKEYARKHAGISL